jgi:hypothetical protein
MDAIRSIERSLLAAPGEAGKGCHKPAAPQVMDLPSTGKAQMDLVAMALACDLTRVASLQWRSSDTPFTWLGITTGHHDLSHQQGNPAADQKLTAIATWLTQQAAYLIAALKAMPDVDGRTVFDNSLFFWVNELAIGTHRLTHAPFLLAAGDFTTAAGKKLETGRYLTYPGGTPHSGLLTVIGQMFGLPLTNFGAQIWQRGPLPNVV